MAEYATAEVWLWDRRVGALAESDSGERIFEYDPAFRRSGLEISPIHLPLSRGGPQTYPDLVRSPAFEGLPGVVADSLPDAFGRRLIREYFQRRGHTGEPTPLQRLLYVGGRGPGALTYRPGEKRETGTEAALEVRELVDQARRVIEGDAVGAVGEIMRVGATVGGARPKAVILWDRDEARVRSGHATPEPGEEHWIIKFDGVTRDSGGPLNRVTGEPGPWGRVEYAYSRLARRAGIAMSETHLLHDGDLAHFMTRRFDRPGPDPADRLHMHTLGGITHLDYNVQYQIGYEYYFDTLRRLGCGQDEVDEAFRRMVFSVATVNFDDHLKNFAFLMDREGRWRLAPAYDVAFAENEAWTRQHQMSINGRFREIRRSDLEAVAAAFDVPAGGREIIEQVLSAVGHWTDEARDTGLDAARITWFERRLERVRGELGGGAGR
jgi:serine/threonine-protein kinase HipA